MTTENNTPTPSTEQSQVTDYDAEWERDSDDDSEAPIEKEAFKQVPVDEPEDIDDQDNSDKSREETSQDVDSPQDSPNDDSKPASETDSEDIWQNASEEQLRAYKKAENEYKAMLGRHRLAQEKLSRLEKEANELKEKARTPTQFEQDHPDYFKELQDTFGSPKAGNTSDTPDTAAIEAVITAHPDAGEVVSSESFNEWLSGQPKVVQRAADSSNAEDVIDVLNDFKSYSDEIDIQRAREARLAKAQAPSTTSSIPTQTKLSSEMSDEELYELEWQNS